MEFVLGTFIREHSLLLMLTIELQKTDKGNDLLKYSRFNSG
jgi:hypothetical protein